MDRRAFFIGVAGALAGEQLRAQEPKPKLPIVGLLHSASAPFASALQKGLSESGFADNKNVVIEPRFANNQTDRLPALAADLVNRHVSVIVCNGVAVKAAIAATTSIPIVFITGADPVEEGLIHKLSRPGGNVTGVTFFGGEQLVAKRIELLHELVPDARSIAVLIDVNNAGGQRLSENALEAGRVLKRRIVVLRAAGESDIEPAFAKITQAGASGLIVGGSALFTTNRAQLIALTAKHRLPAIYTSRIFVSDGGLMSYAGNIADAYRLAGVYVGRILKGAKPAELPVQQPTTIELVLNLKTAKTLGITVPQTILVRADEVIQ
jgi:putative ABC transport system substrate-binding protein